MARLGRKTAGRMVRNLATRFGDRLLDVEQVAFDDAEALFRKAAVTEMGALRTALATFGDDPARIPRPARDRLVRAMAATVAAVEGVAGTLARDAAAMAGDAILEELSVCERTLPGRYKGLAADVADNVPYDTIAGNQVALYVVYAADVKVTFENRLPTQFVDSDGGDSLVRRVLSPEPVGERGFGGRGLWWQALTGVRSGLRDVSVSTANTVRIEAMHAFNDLGDGRG